MLKQREVDSALEPVILPVDRPGKSVANERDFGDRNRRREIGGVAVGRFPGFAVPLLFELAPRLLFDDPRMAAFRRRAGLINDWLASKSRPDM